MVSIQETETSSMLLTIHYRCTKMRPSLCCMCLLGSDLWLGDVDELDALVTNVVSEVRNCAPG